MGTDRLIFVIAQIKILMRGAEFRERQVENRTKTGKCSFSGFCEEGFFAFVPEW